MTDRQGPEHGDDLDAALDASFGFASESWMERLRDAHRDAPLGAIDEYELLEEVARGGQGVVFKARQPGTDRLVAIKRLSAGRLASERERTRFGREVELISAMRHPGIVTLHGLTAADEAIVLEWVEGATADTWSDRVRPGGVRRIVEIARKTCEAVAYAHRRGVMHRDLKPGNILVDAEDQPRVVDFGLARAAEPGSGVTMTDDGSFLGTPAYAAPEQIDGADIDARTDVYAMGCVLYRLLAGRDAFASERGLSRLFEAIRRGDPPPPSAIAPEVGGELDAITLRAMSPDPRRRYQTMDALSDDLARWLEGKAVAAHPPTARYLAGKTLRRHKLASALGAAAIAAILAGTAISVWFAIALAGERSNLQTALGDVSVQRDRAQRETVRARAVYLLFNDIIRQIAAEPASSAPMEKVDALADRLGKSMPLAPDLQAAVRVAIGQLYHHSGRAADAMAQYTEAIAMEPAIGEPTTDTADACAFLGQLQHAGGDPDAGAASLREAVRRMESLHIENTHMSRFLLVDALVDAGRVGEARRELLEGQRILEQHGGADFLSARYRQRFEQLDASSPAGG